MAVSQSDPPNCGVKAWLTWLVSVESALIGIGAHLLRQAKLPFDKLYSRSKDTYHNLQVQLGGHYSHILHSTKDTVNLYRGRVMSKWKTSKENLHLSAIELKLKYRLDFHHLEFKYGVVCENLKKIVLENWVSKVAEGEQILRHPVTFLRSINPFDQRIRRRIRGKEKAEEEQESITEEGSSNCSSTTELSDHNDLSRHKDCCARKVSQ